ncbi:MAG TPA: site-specific DNA-methyltransferase [Candidatus Rifleibacterium sp.]|nr:site-specific DNA-methyltransferase [Candidatus Rifleibacterium sp.]HPT46714.1 site-specific DNA-methyltransferase [Candidatus Rifleibacterium sp.]
MNSLNGKSLDVVTENIARLKELFPDIVTDGKIDFDALKEVLGEFIDGRDERYSFTWNGKSKAKLLAQTPSTGTLRPCPEESVDWDTTKNIFIEGDNLEVLKLLQKSYYKKIKMIYIDPPYNTGKDFVYKDDFRDNIKNYKQITGQLDSEGKNISNNPETSGRYHTDWLNMMYPRLKVARNLLRDDGVIFISIDDNEVFNLRKLCDEIFGEENFVANIIWKKRSTPPNDKKIGAQHDYIVLYSKTSSEKALNLKERTEEQTERYTNPDNHPKGPWASGDLMANVKGGRFVKSLYFPIVNPRTGKEHYPSSNGNWRFNKEKIDELIKNDEIYFGANDDGRPKLKRFLSEVKAGITWTTLWDFVPFNTQGSSEMADIFGNLSVFENPKPVGLIYQMILAGSGEKDIILDFFAGSSTSAVATFQANQRPGAMRKFISIQLPEVVNQEAEAYKAGYKTIAEIGKERIRRAAKKIKEKNPDYEGDLGFKVFKLDSTNIKPWEADQNLDEKTLESYIDNIKADRSESDVLYEILLKYGLDLTLPIKEHMLAGQKVFDIGMGALLVCLGNEITPALADEIVKLYKELAPEVVRVILRDSGFKDDVAKTNVVQILKQADIQHIRSL